MSKATSTNPTDVSLNGIFKCIGYSDRNNNFPSNNRKNGESFHPHSLSSKVKGESSPSRGRPKTLTRQLIEEEIKRHPTVSNKFLQSIVANTIGKHHSLKYIRVLRFRAKRCA